MPDRAAVRARVEALTRVLTIPTVVTRISAMIAAGNASAAEIAAEIGRDQVLAAKVLKLVNSGFYGFRQPVTTITHATVLLGTDVVRTLVVTSTVVDMVFAMNERMEGLWEHSVATARAAGALAERCRLSAPEEVAVCGLLHDIGKVIVAQAFPAEHARIRQLVDQQNCLQIEAEQEVLGVAHPEVGMWLLKKWSFPPGLVNPVAYHSNFHPRRDYADRTAVVHLADILVRAKGIGFPGDRRIPSLDPEAWAVLGLETDDLDDVLALLDDEVSVPFV